MRFCLWATAKIFRSGAAAWSCREYFVQAIEMFYSTRELSEMLEYLGFTKVSSEDAVGGFMAMHRARKPKPASV